MIQIYMSCTCFLFLYYVNDVSISSNCLCIFIFLSLFRSLSSQLCQHANTAIKYLTVAEYTTNATKYCINCMTSKDRVDRGIHNRQGSFEMS